MQEINTFLSDAVGDENLDSLLCSALCLCHATFLSIGRPQGSPLHVTHHKEIDKLLAGETGFAQSLLHHIHRFNEVNFLEEAKVAHAKDLPLQMLLPALEDNFVLFAQLLQ